MLPTGAIAGLEWLEGQRRLVPVAFGTADQRFFAAVADVLDAIAPKLRACADPACSRLFLRHGRKDYCSGRCSQKIRTAKYRSEHPEKVREWKRQEYASHQRAQHGKPNLRIAKRRPQKRRAAQPQMARRVEW
jgi:hypothetical protein